MRRLSLLICLIGSLSSLAARAEEPSALVVADTGGLGNSEWRAIRGLTLAELRKKGANVLEEAAFEQPVVLDQRTYDEARRLGVKKLFVLRISGRLGQKVPMSLDEMTDPPAVAWSASMTAGTLDDAEQVVPRLVDAVLNHSSAEATAERSTVTKNEARPYNKKATEKFFFVGLPIGLFKDAPAPDNNSIIGGLSFALQWETENFRLGPEVLFAYKGGRYAGGASADLVFLPLNTSWSPYIGAGIGYFGGYDGGGFGAKGTVGVETFRLYGIRLNVGVEVLFPFYDSTATNTYRVYPLAHIQFGW
ncbi:MAG: hypothetical protein JST92_20105 [Deltaproteobacteria bacterium]|nr:hypothetical protein [Deltaproteobacteria bacterium]